MNRREFLRLSGGAVAGIAVLPLAVHADDGVEVIEEEKPMKAMLDVNLPGTTIMLGAGTYELGDDYDCFIKIGPDAHGSTILGAGAPGNYQGDGRGTVLMGSR